MIPNNTLILQDARLAFGTCVQRTLTFYPWSFAQRFFCPMFVCRYFTQLSAQTRIRN